MLINNLDIAKLGFRVKEDHSNDLLPSFSHIASGKIPGHPGERYSRTDIETKEITFDVRVEGCNSYEEVEHKCEEFKHYFLDEYSEFKEVSLQFPYTDKRINVLLSNAMPVERRGTTGVISVSVIMLDPYKYDAQAQIIALGVTPAKVYGAQSMSDTKAVFTFTFGEAASELLLTHLGLNQYVRLVHDFVIGDTVVIDMEEELVTKNGLRIMPDLALESKFFPIRAGENEINVDALGTLTIGYTPKYL